MSARIGLCRLWVRALALTLGAVFLGANLLGAAPALGSAPVQTVPLEYRELEGSVINWSLATTPQAQPFKVEPKSDNQRVIRGVWSFGDDPAHRLGWIWDASAGKLYVDLNRNQDLTDDPRGVFSCREGNRRSKSNQTFPGVRLVFKTAMGEHRAFGDVSLYSYGSRQLGASFACRSLWAGQFSARGREWELGLVEALGGSKLGVPDGGYLVVRRWEARGESFDLNNGSLEGFPYCPEVYFGKQNYQISCVYTQQNGLAKYDLKLQEAPLPLGELKLSGQFIKRLLLKRQGVPGAVVLDTPDAVVQVPVGKYKTPPEVVLKQAGVEAYRRANPGSGNLLVVATNQPAALIVGGPLTNSMVVARHAQSLNMRYQLVGVDGDAYQIVGARKQPEFAVYRANKKIASGQFEFG